MPFWYYLPIYILCCHIFMLCTTDHFATIYSCMLFTHLWENYYVLAQGNIIALTIAGLITLTHQKKLWKQKQFVALKRIIQLWNLLFITTTFYSLLTTIRLCYGTMNLLPYFIAKCTSFFQLFLLMQRTIIILTFGKIAFRCTCDNAILKYKWYFIAENSLPISFVL